MKKFYFTFSIDHPMKNFVQVIYADSEIAARRKMNAIYSNKWAFMYNEIEWRKYKEMGYFVELDELDPVCA